MEGYILIGMLIGLISGFPMGYFWRSSDKTFIEIPTPRVILKNNAVIKNVQFENVGLEIEGTNIHIDNINILHAPKYAIEFQSEDNPYTTIKFNNKKEYANE